MNNPEVNRGQSEIAQLAAVANSVSDNTKVKAIHPSNVYNSINIKGKKETIDLDETSSESGASSSSSDLGEDVYEEYVKA